MRALQVPSNLELEEFIMVNGEVTLTSPHIHLGDSVQSSPQFFSHCCLQVDRAPRGQSFVGTFVKCFASRWAYTVAAPLFIWITRTSYIDGNKR